MHNSDRAESEDPSAPAGLSRRALLARAAAGTAIAGAAWTAPSILTVDAASAAFSCTQSSRLDWSTQIVCTSPVGIVVGTVTVGITPSGTGINDCFDVRQTTTDACRNMTSSDFPRGLPTASPAFNQADDDFYSLQKNASGNAVSVTYTFSKSGPVALSGVTFCIGDIDLNFQPFFGFGSVYTDQVTITAVNSAGAAMTAGQVASNISVVKAASPNAPSGSNPFTGVGTLVTDTSADVVVTFQIPIRSFTVTFANIAASPEGPQWIAISDLLWCPP